MNTINVKDIDVEKINKLKEWARLKLQSMIYSNEAFVDLCVNDLREYYVKFDTNKYLVRNDNKWEEVDRNGFRRIIRNIIEDKLMPYGLIDLDKKTVDTIHNFVNNKLDGLINLIPKSDDERIKFYSKFNKQKNIIPLKGGYIYDMKKKEVRESTTKDLFTHELQYEKEVLNYNKDEEIKKILLSWLDYDDTVDKLINHIYRCIGGYMSRNLTIFTGLTKNGKSTLLSLITEIFDPFVGVLSEKIFIEKKMSESSITSHLASIDKYRIGIFNEAEGKLNQSLIKRITGGDGLTVRDLYKSEYTTKATASLLMSCNDPPEMKRNDAMYGRIRAYNFPNTFRKNDKFEEELEELKPYFFAYIMRHGKIELDDEETQSMVKARTKIELENDLVQQYLNETEDYIKCEDGIFKAKDFFQDFKNWKYQSDIETKIIKKEVLKILDDKGYVERKTQEGRYRIGLKRNDELL